LEKSPDYSRKFSLTLEFAVVTRNKFTRADPPEIIGQRQKPTRRLELKYRGLLRAHGSLA